MSENTINTDIFTEDVVKGLKELESKTGVRFSKIEEDYKTAFNKLDVKLPLPTRRSYALMMVKAETSNLGDNPLVDYETLVLGTVEMPKSARVICFTMMVKKGQNGENIGDPKDLFDPATGKLGIPSVASFFDGTSKSVIDKLTPFSWWNANLTVTGTGVARREVSATSYTNFTPINKPDVTAEQIQIWKDRTFPLMTLADIKKNPTKMLPARKEGARSFPDSLDIRRCIVALKRAAMNSRTDGSDFCSYTVVDNSLTDSELLNIKDAEGKIKEYGGVQIFVSKSQYITHNLAEESLIEFIGTASMKCQKCNGSGKVGEYICSTCNGNGQDIINGKLSMNAIAITPIVKKERKVPLTQKAAGAGGKPTSTSLAAMAGAPATTYV
jgi:hypothetical protein